MPEAQTVGEGEAWILTGGRLLEGTWRKGSPAEVTQYLDADGNPISLTPGQTWVNLPPPGRATIAG